MSAEQDGVQDYCACYSADDCTCRLHHDGFGSAPFWALDARDPDDTRCWIDVPDRLTGGIKACNQPPAPDSTLCAGHRTLLADTTAGA